MKIKLLFSLMFGVSTLANATEGYYRFPALAGDTLVFTAEGDLWVAGINQPQARRLTTHPAEETMAALSKDGKYVAFVANYDGANEVYMLPIEGGLAKRLTFEQTQVKVHGWTASGEVLYSTTGRAGMSFSWNLLKVNPDNLKVTELEVADAVDGVLDDTGKHLYFSQFGLQVSADNTRQYRGGATGELWHFIPGKDQEATALTASHDGSVRRPMLHNNKLYFISDSSGNDNIWRMNLDGSGTEQVTKFTNLAVRHASLSGDNLVFQLGADLQLLNLATGTTQKLPLDLTSDFPNLREHWENKPLRYLTSTSLAGEQEKAVLTARGRIAISGIDKSRLVEIATPKNSRSRNALLSHDGKWVYAFNDASGEMEIWRYAADGSSDAKQLTQDGNTYRWNLSLSPDGNSLVHDDKKGNVWLLDIVSGKNRKILSGYAGLSPIASLSWSPDSSLLAIAGTGLGKDRGQITLFDVKKQRSQILTSEKYESYAPAFSQDGNWLYFLSNRHFVATPNSPWGDRNMGPAFDRRSQIFAYALDAKARFPFQANDELLAGLEKNIDEDKKDKDSKEDKKASQLDWQGISERLWQVSVPAGNYKGLQANKDYLYVLDQISEPGSKPVIKSIEINPQAKLETFKEGVAEFALSTDGKKMLVRQDGADNANIFIVDAKQKFPSDTSQSKLNSQDWQMLLNPSEEWQQMFHDAWLMHRDSLFDKRMRGLDWAAVKDKYQPLLKRVTDRYELNDVFAQMMGELNTLHSQVYGGDVPNASERPRAASLGARFTQTSKGLEISHIFQHDPELPERAAPLAKPGVDAKPGDIILAVNGQPVKQISELVSALRNQHSKQVLLELKRGGKSHQTVVTPVSNRDANQLRYLDWVSQNRHKVEQANPDFGYLHINAMGGNDIAEFAREFYANYNKKGLVIDVRRNRGGNIDSWLIEKLMRKAWAFWENTQGEASTNMQSAFRGHLVVLADQYTYSDGETFTAAVKTLNLAPVVGKRTAGAGVWLTGRNRLADNGMARVAEFAQYAMDGRWIVEGYGVAPSIEVDNLPHATFKGQDAQLRYAIDYLEKQLKAEPIPELKGKPLPDVNTPAADVLK
ncbi:PD40 domain-containing protein [Bowmanella sp. Y26]|uniref:S41 family peptidase n=1 Tax=Bowmanella yangjiangensis TaxID=2811230 RepID=UPI001BDCE05E|nr:S41 family peptidase [Bowmanella yangjiangensis]MBT1063108.1 PD40 domain-containing protein [Bowmanella yangjiangensis]